ncbi:hypothetical protein CEE45_15905 [Candidatus Heimdallarchaeota archaeon B3_Heim]|nr:MAG: hypothetical protein CEE45_15905 [Candidatus Heimdallarchaeota archaeon B3_Heim]
MGFILKWITKHVSFLIIFAFLILFSGIIALGFTYVIYPTLVPSYGAGEPFHLTSYNNYTTQFPWYSKTRIHLTIKANDSIEIFIDGISVFNGSFYKTSIEPQNQTLIKLQSVTPVSGKFLAWQEPSWLMQITASCIFLLGLVATVSVSAIYIWSHSDTDK